MLGTTMGNVDGRTWLEMLRGDAHPTAKRESRSSHHLLVQSPTLAEHDEFLSKVLQDAHAYAAAPYSDSQIMASLLFKMVQKSRSERCFVPKLGSWPKGSHL